MAVVLALLALLLATPAFAQAPTRMADTSTGQGVSTGSTINLAQRVVCVNPTTHTLESCAGTGGGAGGLVDQGMSGVDPWAVSFLAPQHIICDSGCGTAAAVAMADATANPTIPQTAGFGMLFNGVTWDRWRGDTTSGAFVNVKNASIAVTGTFFQVTQPVSGTVTTTPPANASSNVAQVNGTTTDSNSGLKSAGTLRVVLATDQPALTNKLLVTPDSVALPANQSVNAAQLAGTTTDTNSGLKSAGTLRVVLATDQPALTNKLLVTPDSVALPANQSVNVSQINAVTPLMGVGASGTGAQRVAALLQDGTDVALVTTAGSLQVDQFSINGTAIGTAAAGVQKVGIVGNANAALDAANNAAMPANAIANGAQTATIDTSPTAATAGNLRYELASTEGVQYVQEGGPKRFSCLLQAVTVLTQCQAAPAAGLRAYVTSVSLSNQAATVQTLDVVFGTGANCATGATALTHKWQFGTVATTTSPFVVSASFPTPLVPTAANAICVRPSAATAFGATITGYIAP